MCPKDILSWFVLFVSTATVSSTEKFISVSLMFNTQLYDEFGNEDAPSATDPVLSNLQTRKHICKDIADSGYYRAMEMGPASDDPLHLFAYEAQKFQIESNQLFTEHVFECRFEELEHLSVMYPFFVSKEYNVSPFKHSRMPGRFIFASYKPDTLTQYSVNYILLAEGPAKPYNEPGFNVEIYYLRIRTNAQSTEENSVDPLCTLISGSNSRRHYHRLCTSVCTGKLLEYDSEVVGYAIPREQSCHLKKVGFRTKEGLTMAARKTYQEQMTECDCTIREHKLEVIFYISRAYFSNQLLVYRHDLSEDVMYLENLCTYVAIVDELNSFDFVED